MIFEILAIIMGWITVILGWITLYLKSKLIQKEKKETEIWKNKRDIFQELLKLHMEVANSKHMQRDDWIDDFFKMLSKLILIAPDRVLKEYIKYFKARVGIDPDDKLSDCEIFFGKAILAYRKEFGHHNYFGKIKAKDIALIIKAGGSNIL